MMPADGMAAIAALDHLFEITQEFGYAMFAERLRALACGCALLLVSSAMMGLAGFVSVQVLTPLAVFFVALSFIVVWMVTKLLRYLTQQQAASVACGSGEAA